jgi:hypothetical protein
MSINTLRNDRLRKDAKTQATKGHRIHVPMAEYHVSEDREHQEQEYPGARTQEQEF